MWFRAEGGGEGYGKGLDGKGEGGMNRSVPVTELSKREVHH